MHYVLFRLFVLKYTVVQLLRLYLTMQCLEKELDLSGWIMCGAEHNICSWRSVILLAGETIIVDIQRMLVSDVEVSCLLRFTGGHSAKIVHPQACGIVW